VARGGITKIENRPGEDASSIVDLPTAPHMKQFVLIVDDDRSAMRTRAAEILQIDPSTLYRREKQGSPDAGAGSRLHRAGR
jgi:hypothetical protein